MFLHRSRRRAPTGVVACFGVALYLAWAYPVYAAEEQLITLEASQSAWAWIFYVSVSISFVYFLFYFYRLRAKMEKNDKSLREAETELNRLRQLFHIFDECLFEYCYSTDTLKIENNEILFPGKSTVEGFLDGHDYSYHTENELMGVTFLKEMVRRRESVGETTLNVGGETHWYCVKIGFIDEDYAVGRISDISEVSMEKLRLRKEADSDPLTGLLNRNAMENFLDGYLKNKAHQGVYLLLDLDNFKCVNDTLGHDEGDRLLRNFAEFLVENFRASDMIARLGGDEFAVFMPGVYREEDLDKKMSWLIRELHSQVFCSYKECGLSVSIGVAVISNRVQCTKDLYREADNAMYVAKRGGKDDFFISDGTSCMRQECIGCKEKCKRQDYLRGRGVNCVDKMGE